MSERHDRVPIVETGGGGGAAIAGLLTAAAIFLAMFFLFGERIYSGGSKSINVDVKLPSVEAPARQ